MALQSTLAAPELAELRARALAHSRDKDWRPAYQAWSELLAQAADDAEALYRLCEACFWLGSVTEAIAFGERYHARRPDDARVQEFLGRCYTTVRDYRAARALWQIMLARNADYFEGWIRLGQCQLAEGELEAAVASLDKAFALDPLNAAAYPIAGRILRRISSSSASDLDWAHNTLARWLAAIEKKKPGGGHRLLDFMPRRQSSRQQSDWEALVASEDEEQEPVAPPPKAREPRERQAATASVADLTAQARSLHGAQDWERAAAAWAELRHAAPRNFEAHFRLGQALAALKRPQEAIAHFRTAHELRPAHAQALSDYADALAASGQRDAAIEVWRNGELAGDAAIQARRAVFLHKVGETAQAADVAVATLSAATQPDRNAVLLARLLTTMGDWRTLVAQLERLCRREPARMAEAESLELAVRHAVALANTGAAREAIAWFQFADEHGPCNRLVTRNYIRILARLNQVELAQATVERMLARAGQEHWAWLDAIDAHVSLGAPDVAYSCFVTACEQLNLTFEEWLEFAEKIELYEARALILERVRQHATDDSALLARMARVAFRQGDTRLALDLAHRASQRAPDDPAIRSEVVDLAYYHNEIQRLGFDLDKVAFPDSAFELICRHILEHPRRMDAVPGVIVLSNSSLAAGGAERQIAMTLSGLSRLEEPQCSLHLVCRDLSGTEGRDRYLEFIRQCGVSVVDLSENEEVSLDEVAGLSEAERRLLRLFDPNLLSEILGLYVEFARLRPQVVHLWQDRTNLVGAVAAALAGVPRVVLCGRSTRPVTRQRYRPYMPRAYHAVMQLPGVVLANNSRAGAADYAAWLGLELSSVEVIYNGFEFDRMVKPEDAKLAPRRRRDLGIGPDDLVVGGVFRISPVKRPMLWADTARRVADRMGNVHFMIAGEGPLHEEMTRYVAQLGLSDRFHFLGHVDVGPWYLTMDALLLTSETEGLPNVVIEAQAFGVPAVSTNVGGVREIIVENSTGYTVDKGDADQLADRLVEALSNAKWRKKARRTARDHARRLFGADSMIARTLQVYRLDEAPRADDLAFQALQPGDAAEQGQSAPDADSPAPPALQALEQSIAPLPAAPAHLAAIGWVRFQAGRLEEARQLFAQAQRLAPAHPEPLRWLARTWRGLGEHREALLAWRRLLRLAPADREAHIRAMEALVCLGLTGEATRFAQRALKVAPEETDILRQLARIHRSEGNHSAALVVWDAILARDGNDFEALFRSGEIALQLENDALAEQRLHLAAAHERRDPRPVLILARHLSWAGRLREARRLLRAALLKQPRHPEIWRTVFDLIRVAGRAGLADRVLARLQRRHAGNSEDRLFFAELLICAQHLDAAQRQLQALASDPGVGATAICRLSRMTLRRGDLVAAERLAARLPSAAAGDNERKTLAAAIAECEVFLRMAGGAAGARWPAPFIDGIARLLQARPRPRYEPRPGVVMHVLNSLAAGGTERQCATVAKAQAARGRGKGEVWVVRTDPRRAGRGAFFLAQLAEGGVHSEALSAFAARAAVIPSQLPELSEPPEALRAIVNTREIAGLVAAIETIRPEIVQAWTPQCSAHAALAGLIAGTSRIALRGGSVAPDARPFLTDVEADRHEWLRTAIDFALDYPSVRLVNNCRANLHDWLRWLGRKAADDPDRFRVVHNLLDVHALREADEQARAALATRLGLAGKRRPKVIGSVMRLEREKDPDLWVDIVAEMSRRRQDVKFVLVGDGRLRQHVERRLQTLGVADLVILAGTVSDGLAEHYALFDAFLLTSHFEGLPNVLLEAQHYGVPVVGPEVGGVGEAMASGKSGFAVAGRAPQPFADALERMLDDDALRRRMATAGRQFVARFAAAAVLDEFEAVYALPQATPRSRLVAGSRGR